MESPLPVESLNIQLMEQTTKAKEQQSHSLPRPPPPPQPHTTTNASTPAATMEAPPPSTLPGTTTDRSATMEAPPPSTLEAPGTTTDPPGTPVVSEERDVEEVSQGIKVPSMVVVHAFEGDPYQGQLMVTTGETVEVLDTPPIGGMRWVRSSNGTEGFVPEGNLSVTPRD